MIKNNFLEITVTLVFFSASKLSNALETNKVFDRLAQQFQNLIDNNQEISAIFRNIPGNLNAISSYGCWCNFDNGIGSDAYGLGRSQPLDAFDKACKVLRENYRCLDIDGEFCDIHNTEFISSIGSGGTTEMDKERLIVECAISNANNPCAEKLCQIEGFFVQTIFKHLFQDGMVFDNNLDHKNPNFDFDSSCQLHDTNDNDRYCCGEFPERWPFKSDGTKACCVDKLYNTMFKTCCDGSVQDIFSCME